MGNPSESRCFSHNKCENEFFLLLNLIFDLAIENVQYADQLYCASKFDPMRTARLITFLTQYIYIYARDI